MFLPALKSNVTFEEKSIKQFGGINTTDSAKSGDLYKSINMTSADYPALSSRKRRSVLSRCKNIINGLGVFDGFIYTHCSADKNRIFLNFSGVDYEYTAYTSSADYTANRCFAALSDCLLIIPDNTIFYVNSRSFSKICVSQSFNSASAKEKFLTESGGSTLLNSSVIDYVASLDHNKITCRNISYTSSGTKTFYYSSFDTNLKSGDVITLKMTVYSERADDDAAYREYRAKMREGITLKIKDCTTVEHTVASGSISETVELIFDSNSIDTGGYRDVRIESFSIDRGMPSLSSICSFNNRIWAIAGKEIYTSKLSDPSEWNDYTVDEYGTLPYACYNTSSQTEGNFTAIIPYGNYIYAFKENVIHKIYGNAPDEYTLYTENHIGTKKGAGLCVCSCTNSIVFGSYDGIYSYSGDYPIKISEGLEIPDSLICAAANENHYYLLTKSGSDKQLYVYDLKKKLWHIQDAPEDSKFLCSHGNNVYLATSSEVISITDYTKDEYERYVRWEFRLRVDDKEVEKKGFGQLSIRYSLGKDATFTVRAIYDDSSLSAVCGARNDEAAGCGYKLCMPIKRCSWFDLEFCGTGDFKLKSMNLKFYRGSEV